MIDTEKVKMLTLQAIAEEGAFLVEFSVGANNRITVHADHPEGITLRKLGKISRAIDNNLDREQEDFEIEVSSPGVGQSFKVEEQYKMNIGRPVVVTLQDGAQLKGEMTDYNGESLELSWKERVPKKVGKGKENISRKETVSLDKIKETRLEIRF